MNKILNNPRYFKLIYQVLIVFVFTQQIYFTQTFKYFHLAAVAVRFLLADVYQPEDRSTKYDRGFIFSIVIVTVVSIIEKIANIQLSLVYLLGLVIAIIFLLMIIKKVISDSKDYKTITTLTAGHVEALKKNKTLTIGMFYMLYGIALVALVYSFYEIIILIR